LAQTNRETTEVGDTQCEQGALTRPPAQLKWTQSERKEVPFGRSGEQVIVTSIASADATRMQPCKLSRSTITMRFPGPVPQYKFSMANPVIVKSQ
jgi:hypothetical protein